MLDTNAIISLDLLPSSHISGPVGAAAGPTALAAAAKGAAVSSLFGLLDRTASAAGKRKLKQWICR
jgi:DNA mismatch repair ATPase MutS